MAEILIMPRLTDTMEEGVVASILVKEGDKVKSGDLLAEIETDKATMEWESFVDGEVLYIGVSEGEGVPVNDPVLILGKKGEDISDLKAKFGQSAENGNSSSESKEEPKQEATQTESKKETEQPKQEKSSTKKVDTSSINAVVLRMRKMTDTMEEGVLASWLVKVGDKLKSGDVIAEVETDKATMDFDIYDDGEVLYLAAEEGDSVPIDAPIAVIGEKGADYQALLDAESVSNGSEDNFKNEEDEEQQETKKEVKSASMSSSNSSNSSNANSEGRIFISPLAKKMAEENGYDINQIEGSGENGRITKKDIENFTPKKATESKTDTKQVSQSQSSQSSGQQAQQAAPAFAQGGTRDEKVSQMRKAIAKSLAASKFTAPHFYLTIAVDMKKAIKTRAKLNEVGETKVSYNDLVIKATALALQKHPAINASWQGETIRYNDNIHMGVAVAVDEGLLVPVVRFAEMKTLSQINKEVKEFAGKAKDKKLQPSDWEGSTFTISNLGMFGIEEFTAIINAPNACILAVGAIVEQPVVKEGKIKVGNIMKMTLSCDHRVVDGAVGAAFLQTLKDYMENPMKMLV